MAFSITRYIPSGSVVLAITMLLSYVLGLLRDRTLARTFGASTSLDSYNAAFLIPDFMFSVLVASGIAAAAVPLFVELYERNIKVAHEYMNSLLISAVGVMVLVGAFLGIFAPFLSVLVAPGLDDAGRLLTAQMMRVLSLSAILFAGSNAFGAMLVAQKRFLFYGLSPAAYNLGIIAGAIFLAPHFGIMGVAYGTVLGAGLHTLLRVIAAVREGWRFTWISRPFASAHMKRTIVLMLPKMVGHPVELLTFWVFTAFASFLSPGSISILNFARNFQSVPVSLIGIAISTAAFPLLSKAFLISKKEFIDVLRRISGTIFLASACAALILFFIRYPLISILLGGGEFTSEAVAETALVLGVFCLAIPTEAVSHVLARAFYSAQNTVLPVAMSVASFLIASAGAYVFLKSLGILGLPLGFFLGSLVRVLGLWLLLPRILNRR